ncbi:hypothetical protein CHS0354_009410 [Potamilus streckersoni]|uniref:ZP domain-containing protein n=1 Tax=Potamilus streckersoni TaxID=2493646 RepID=A0AAE0T430_9BIVA|nr:hypothetical protein CHS0354_009410 [Potamilus streckersoni]
MSANVSTNKVPSVTPSFRVYTKFYSNSSRNVLVKKASVGTKLHWTIEGPSEYHLMPLNCKAFSGSTAGGDLYKDIIIDGCSANYDLVGDFSVAGPGELATSLFAFRFFNSNYVTFQCVVRVCPANSDICDFDCPSTIRMKRDSRPTADDPSIQQQSVITHLSIVPPDVELKPLLDVSSVTSLGPSIFTLVFITVIQVL